MFSGLKEWLANWQCFEIELFVRTGHGSSCGVPTLETSGVISLYREQYVCL